MFCLLANRRATLFCAAGADTPGSWPAPPTEFRQEHFGHSRVSADTELAPFVSAELDAPLVGVGEEGEEGEGEGEADGGLLGSASGLSRPQQEGSRGGTHLDWKGRLWEEVNFLPVRRRVCMA